MQCKNRNMVHSRRSLALHVLRRSALISGGAILLAFFVCGTLAERCAGGEPLCPGQLL